MQHTSTQHLDTKRWWALTWISLTQLMMVVVSTVMNIAVPAAQTELGLTDTQRQWVITIYLLAFGALLLLGGRISDIIGRRKALLIGLAGFTAASIVGGVAVNPEMLLTARAFQGAFSALIAPSALALLSVTFQTGTDRAKAFGIFGTIMGAGSGIGVIAGGILTETWGWRAAMFVNVPIAAIAAVGLILTVKRDQPQLGRVDLLGGFLSAGGLIALTYELTTTETSGWTSLLTLSLFGLGAILITLFFVRQRLTPTPLLPLTLFSERLRSAAFLAMLSWGIAIMPVFLFLSIFLQQVAGFSPLMSGLAFLPYTLAILITVRLIRPLNTLLSTRTLISSGLVIIAIGLLTLSMLTPEGSYWTQVLPVLVLLGIGTATVQPASNSAATHLAGSASGAAGAVASTAQQVGSSIGMALLGSVAATATASMLATLNSGGEGTSGASGAESAASAVTTGFATAGLVGSVILGTAALAVFLLAGRPQRA